MKSKLNQCGILNRITTSGLKKIETVVARFNVFFNLLTINVTYLNGRLVFKPILQPIFEHVCKLKPLLQCPDLAEPLILYEKPRSRGSSFEYIIESDVLYQTE